MVCVRSFTAARLGASSASRTRSKNGTVGMGRPNLCGQGVSLHMKLTCKATNSIITCYSSTFRSCA
jgi:hypothetical protein